MVAQFARRHFLAAGLLSALSMSVLTAAVPRGPIVSKIVLGDRRIWVAVKIGKAEPRLFFLDTGASMNMIRPEFAEELKLKHKANSRSKGMGGVAETRIVQALNVNVGGNIHLEEVYFTAINVSFQRDAMGVLAADTMTSMDSDLDVEKLEWRIWPDGRADRTGMIETDSDIDRQGTASKIFVTVKVNGLPLRMLLDTGAPGNLVIGNAAAKRIGLWDDAKPYAPAQVRGIGGASDPGRFVKIGVSQFAGVDFRNVVSFIEGPGGSNRYGNGAEGIIGLNMLQHFTLSTDVKRGKLWVQQNGLKPTRMLYPLHAIWFEEKAGKVVVEDVGTGSPAAVAGLRRGDVVAGETLRSAIEKVRGEPGKVITLKVLRNGLEQPVSFALKPYL